MKYSDDRRIEKNPVINIYCKGWCDYLRRLVELLQEKDYALTFIDLRFDKPTAKTLISSLGNPLILPILEINGTYYEKPPFSKVREVLDLSRWRQHVDRAYYGKKASGTH
jgi:arsenate reductase-like glutaredoxin family protein